MGELFGRCVTVLESTGGLPARTDVDDYRSTVCGQLRSMEPVSPVVRRSPVKSRHILSQAPRLQDNIVLSGGTHSVLSSKRTTVSGGSVEKSVNRGQRTG